MDVGKVWYWNVTNKNGCQITWGDVMVGEELWRTAKPVPNNQTILNWVPMQVSKAWVTAWLAKVWMTPCMFEWSEGSWPWVSCSYAISSFHVLQPGFYSRQVGGRSRIKQLVGLEIGQLVLNCNNQFSQNKPTKFAQIKYFFLCLPFYLHLALSLWKSFRILNLKYSFYHVAVSPLLDSPF